MRRLSASLLFLAAAVTFGQAPAQKDSRSQAVAAGQTVISPQVPQNSAGCPVGFSASRQANPQTMLAKDRSQPGPAQGLHLSLHQTLNVPVIESIEVTVYGTSPKLRALPVSAPSSDTISKTFELQRQAGSNSLTEADVWMHNVGSLTRVDLISITYADGATWRPTENFKCRAIPSNFVLVDK